MRRIYTVVAAIGGLSLSLGGTAAVAGSCGMQYRPCPVRIAPPPPPPPRFVAPCNLQMPQANPVPNCQVPFVVNPGAPAQIDPVVIHSSQPLDYLRSVKFSGSPHVNITRIHGQAPSVGLKDVPTAFTGGCHPESTEYCRTPAAAVRPAAVPAPVRVAAPVRIAAPVYVAPAPKVAAPVYVPPAPRLAPAPTEWKKVSGPTMVGNYQATQVVCRQAPAPQPVFVPAPRPAYVHVPEPVFMPAPQAPTCSSGYAPAPMYPPQMHYAPAQPHGWNMGPRYGSNY